MQKLNADVTNENNFFQSTDPISLIEKFGGPLYVYNEKILRERCREMKNLVEYKNFKVNFSAKSNCSLALLQIVKEEGLSVDAMSPGEIFVQLKAGFSPSEIFYICNNVSEEEMKFAIDKNITVSVDSLSQLEQFGRINPNGRVAVRLNPGVGAGHHEKVITAGKKTKFGINEELIPDVKKIVETYHLKLIGINQHIGSLFMDDTSYIKGVESLLRMAENFDDLEFIDLGGGFGIPYHKQEKENRLDLTVLGEKLDVILANFAKKYKKEICFKIEPGRYISAECCVLLGNVHSIKYNGETKYIGTDLGFNVLARPMMYDSHHDIEVYRKSELKSEKNECVTVVGNICETGDILAKNRVLPEIFEGDVLGVLDAGAYGFVMSSTYNNRLRPAEVLIRENGEVVLIREREVLEDLLNHQILL